MASFDVEDVAAVVKDVVRTSRGLKLITVPIVSLAIPIFPPTVRTVVHNTTIG